MRIKLIAAGVGLVGFGAMWGWAITGDAMEAKMKRNQRLLATLLDRKSSELEAAKELIATRGASKVTVVETEDDGELEEVAYNEFSEEESLDEQLRGETPEETRQNLQKIIDRYNNDPDAQEEWSNMATRTLIDNGPDNTPPFVISADEWAMGEEGEEYMKLSLTYYPNDRVLVDEDDEAVDNRDVDSYVGWQNLNRFGDQSGQTDVVYIRNHRLLTDFEVYQETDEELPAHIRYGMGRAEYEVNMAAGVTKFRRSDVGD